MAFHGYLLIPDMARASDMYELLGREVTFRPEYWPMPPEMTRQMFTKMKRQSPAAVPPPDWLP